MFPRTLPSSISIGRLKGTRRPRSFVPTPINLSALEARQVLSTATLSAAGVLTITGTSGPDSINIVQSSYLLYTPNGVYSTGTVKSIVVDGQAGDDSISVNSVLPTTLYGGSGANTYPGVAANAIIVDPALTGGLSMSKAVMDKYQTLGGLSSPLLGQPTGNEVAAYGGRVVRFQGGEIDYSAATGAHEVHGLIGSELTTTANETDAYGTSVRSILGLATSDESATPGGRVSDFQGGEIDYSPTTNAHVLYGAILGERNTTAGETDINGTSVRTLLGFPTADEAATPGGRVTHFQGGDIDYSAATGAHVVYGAILNELNTLANSPYGLASGTLARNVLGLPTADETAVAGGRVTHFQGGDIDYSGPTGAHAVFGSVLNAYASYGGPAGVLGFPTADEAGATTLNGYARVEPFQNGGLAYNGTSPALPASNRTQAIAALTASQANGILDAPEVAYFHDLAGTYSYTDTMIRDLMHKLIDGDPANATYQGVPVGNLAAGALAWRVNDLEGKWFLGTDHPTDTWTRTNSDGTKTNFNGGTYQTVTGPLFGANGPVYSDIIQGHDGDCYFLAALAATTARSPGTIRNMFSENLDGTYTVRFFHNGAPEYVTVDRTLPSGGSYYASAASGGPIWVALAEKAYIQANESGWLSNTIVGSNSYGAIDFGYTQVALNAINGQSSVGGVTQPTTGAKPDLDAIWSNGRALTLCTTGLGYYSTLLVTDHVYAVVGYNSTTKMYTLFNPWGMSGGTELNPNTGRYDFKPGTLTMTSATMLSSFHGYDGSWLGMTAPGLATTTVPAATAAVPATTASKAAPVFVPLALGDGGMTAAGGSGAVAPVRVGLAHPRSAAATWTLRS